MVLCVFNSHGQEIGPKVTAFDWSQFNFTFNENGVEKTANLLDEAKTVDHMKMLLREVYVNPNVPGIRYAYAYRDPATGNPELHRLINYNYNYTSHTIRTHYPGGGGGGYFNTWDRALDGSDTIVNPYEDGMTVLLVQIKENWQLGTYNSGDQSPDEVLENAYASVQVVPTFTRVHDEYNPGYLFSCDVATNRFFFISKGKPRGCSSRPLYHLYEQISPVKSKAGTATYEFIQRMKSGEAYHCYHDCYDVATFKDGANGHWFSISGEGEAYSLKNLCLFVPDRRFVRSQLKDMDPAVDGVNCYTDDGNYYTDYGITKNGNTLEDSIFRPKVLIYTADLNAEAVPSEVEDHYRVTLDWSTSFSDKKLGAHVPEHFYVYIVKDDGSWVRIDDLLNVNEPVENRTGSYLVKQTNETQTFNYVITAHPINYDMDGNIITEGVDTVHGMAKPLVTISAVSPVRTVIIPPLEKSFFAKILEYRSFYDVNSEHNYYRNTLLVRPANQESFDALENFHGSYSVTRTDPDGQRVTIAHVHYAPLGDCPGYSYHVEYIDSTQDTREIGLFGPTSGVEDGVITSFDQSDMVVVDRFKASTITNEHYDHYVYQYEEIDDELIADVCSNPLTVPVLKTTNQVDYVGYDKEDVLADSDHHLAPRPTNVITYRADYDPSNNVTEYDVFRLDRKPNEDVGEYKVSKAENFNNSGRYDVFTVGEEGFLNDWKESRVIPAGDNDVISIEDKHGAVADSVSYYVPVIVSLFGGNQNKVNTYGCNIESIAYPTLSLKAVYQEKTNPFNRDGELVMSYTVDLELTPNLPDEIDKVYYYRLWRVMDENTTMLASETLLNGLDEVIGSNSYTSWSTSYKTIQSTYPRDIYPIVTDIFIDRPYDDCKKVTYIGRLYATNVPRSDENVESPDHMMRSSARGDEYVIAEDIVDVYFDDNVITAVEDLSADQITSVVYYNMMGMSSNRPYQGVNLVVTRYRNGAVVTRKVIM